MKKNVIISLISSLSISVILTVLNRIYAAITGHIVGLVFAGGDCVTCIGFGWYEFTTYPEMSAEAAALWQPVSTYHFEFISFAATALIIFAIAMAICKVKSRKKVEAAETNEQFAEAED